MCLKYPKQHVFPENKQVNFQLDTCFDHQLVIFKVKKLAMSNTLTTPIYTYNIMLSSLPTMTVPNI